MALFDKDAPLSEEPAAMLQCLELLASCSAAQELLEVNDLEAAIAKIYPGPADEPLDGQTFTIEELKTAHAWGQLSPYEQADSLLITRSRAVGCVSEKEGLFRIHWRLMVRDEEYEAPRGRWERYMYFMDRTTRIAEQLVELADLNLNVTQMKRLRGPVYNPRVDWVAQGKFLWCDWLIAWGGSESNG